jgi:hypothetical protein
VPNAEYRITHLASLLGNSLTTPIVHVVRPICTDIHDDNEEPMPENDLYMAIWQSSPAIPRYAAYNWDGLSWSDISYAEAIFGNHKVQLGDTYHLPDPDNEEAVAENEIDVDWFSDYMPLGQNASEPVFDIMYPILDTIDRVTIDDPLNHTLVGMTAVSVYWRNLLEDILPAGSEGVVVVFDSPCNPSFTYQINGPSVEYLGRGDLHDPHVSFLADGEQLHDEYASHSVFRHRRHFSVHGIHLHCVRFDGGEATEESFDISNQDFSDCLLPLSVKCARSYV